MKNKMPKNDVEAIALGLEVFDAADLYLEALNEETVTIAGYDYPEGDALRDVDPIAFGQGAADYADCLCRDGGYTELDDGSLVLTSELEDLLESEDEDSEDEIA